jgi:hypothetical protein
MNKIGQTRRGAAFRAFILCAAILGAFLLLMFIRSLDPDEVPASNDGPLGAMVAQQNRMPAIMTGFWQDLNWIGNENPTPSPGISSALRLVTSPLLYSKVFYPFALFILGISAWFCFRQWKLSPLACILGALATAFSSHFFSTACWGVAAQVIGIAMCFVAVGLSGHRDGWKHWVRLVIAGLAVGINIMEAYDIGAIFSLFVAAYVLYDSLVSESSLTSGFIKGIGQVAIVALFAAFCATQALTVLVGTQIKGSTGETDNMTSDERWDWATQWSMPPEELPRIFISGLYGYRMDTPRDMAAFQDWFQDGLYWGRVGRPPVMDRFIDQYHAQGKTGVPPELGPDAPWRFSGGGEYAGVLVLAVALWAAAQSLRKVAGQADLAFTRGERKYIWFWSIAAFISLLLALGRYAPFYRAFYILPHASNIRNASKFMHSFHWCIVILFAYGIHGISRKYFAATSNPLSAGKSGRKGAVPGPDRGPLNFFEKQWIIGSFVAVGLSLLGWLIYSSNRSSVEKRLLQEGFPSAELASKIAGSSLTEFGLFILFLILTALLLSFIIKGKFAAHAKWGGIALGALLLVDLLRADLPWVIYWNVPVKYANNPVLEFLENKPFEHRVALFPLDRFTDLRSLPEQARPLAGLYGQLANAYKIEWAQHHFQYYNIEAIEDVQRPRESADFKAYERGPIAHVPIRHWELTNTRYFLGLAPQIMGFGDFLNNQVDRGQKRFRPVLQFSLQGSRAVPDTNGYFAVYEFTGALSRAALYGDWQVASNDVAAVAELATPALSTNDLPLLKAVGTNDFLTLRKLASPSFDPHQTVLLAEPLSVKPAASTNTNPGAVEITSYAPKKLVLRAKANAASVLLLNDKYDSNWHATVDGKPETVLRVDYIMRGVALSPGDHEIVFRYTPSTSSLYVSLAAILLGMVLIGVLAVAKNGEAPSSESEPGSKPVPPAKKEK